MIKRHSMKRIVFYGKGSLFYKLISYNISYVLIRLIEIIKSLIILQDNYL